MNSALATTIAAVATAALASVPLANAEVVLISDSFSRTVGNSDDTNSPFLSELGSNDNALGGTVVQAYAETPTRTGGGGVNQTVDGSTAVIDFGAFATTYDVTTDPAVLAGGGYTVAFDFQRGTGGGFLSVFLGYNPASVDSQDGSAAFGPINGQGSPTPGTTDAAFLFQNNNGSGRVQFNSFVGGDADDNVTINFDDVYSDNTGNLTGQHSALLTVLADSFSSGSEATISLAVDGSLVTTQTVTLDGGYAGIIGFSANQGNSRIDNLVIAAVPEPATAGLAALGAGAVLLRRRRQA